MSLRQPDHGFKPCVPARPRIALVRRPEPIPVATFTRLHNALVERNYALAKRLIRELRRYGYSVAVLGPKGGPGR